MTEDRNALDSQVAEVTTSVRKTIFRLNIIENVCEIGLLITIVIFLFLIGGESENKLDLLILANVVFLSALRALVTTKVNRSKLELRLMQLEFTNLIKPSIK